MKNIFILLFLLLTGFVWGQSNSKNDVFKYSKDGFSGLKQKVNGESKIILEAQYDHLLTQPLERFNFVIVSKNNKFGLFSVDSLKLVLPEEYDNIYVNPVRLDAAAYNDALFLKKGVYSSDSLCYTTFVLVVKKEGKYGVLDNCYHVVIPLIYDDINTRYNYASCDIGGKEGLFFFDERKKNIPPKYDVIKNYGGFISAKNDFKYTLFNQYGDELFSEIEAFHLLKPVYTRFRKTLKPFIIRKDSKYGIFIKDSLALPLVYDQISDYYVSDFIVKKADKYGVVSIENEIVVPFLYDSVYFLGEIDKQVYLAASKKGKYALIDMSNKKYTKHKYDEILNINKAFALKRKGKFQVANLKGKLINKKKFTHVGVFDRNSVSVFKGNNIAYLSFDGKLSNYQPIVCDGYTDLQDIYEAAISVLKTENDSLLMNFIKKLCSDEYAVDFRLKLENGRKDSASIRFNESDKLGLLYDNMFAKFLGIRNMLKNYGAGSLSNIQMDGFEDGTYQMQLDKGVNPFRSYDDYYSCNRWVLLKLSNTSDYYKLSLGELILMDNYWRLVSSPELSNHYPLY